MRIPCVTDEDRARGWAELELLFKDGTRRCVRVHAVAQADLLRAACLSQAEAWHFLAARALRETPDFIEQISGFGAMEVSVTLASLLHDNAEAAAMVNSAAQSALSRAGLPVGGNFNG